jgi:hypothetical protein
MLRKTLVTLVSVAALGLGSAPWLRVVVEAEWVVAEVE